MLIFVPHWEKEEKNRDANREREQISADASSEWLFNDLITSATDQRRWTSHYSILRTGAAAAAANSVRTVPPPIDCAMQRLFVIFRVEISTNQLSDSRLSRKDLPAAWFLNFCIDLLYSFLYIYSTILRSWYLIKCIIEVRRHRHGVLSSVCRARGAINGAW